MYVTHDRVHCHWRWQCQLSLFASLAIWINASLPNNDMNGVVPEIVTSNARWSFSFLKIWTTRYLQLVLVMWRIIRVYLKWINGCFGNYLAMVRRDIQDMLHRCQICIEIRGGYVEDVGAWKDHGRKYLPSDHCKSKSWYLAMITKTFKCNFGASCLITRQLIHWRCGCMKGPRQKIPTYSDHCKSKSWYLAMITKTFKCNFGASCLITRQLIHLNYQWLHSLQSSIPCNYQNLQKVGYDIVIFNGMYSVMRDIHDVRMVPMKRGCVALYI